MRSAESPDSTVVAPELTGIALELSMLKDTLQSFVTGLRSPLAANATGSATAFAALAPPVPSLETQVSVFVVLSQVFFASQTSQISIFPFRLEMKFGAH